MLYHITPDSPVASVAQSIIDTCSRQKAATLLAELYGKQMIFMIEALEANDNVATIKHAENIANLELLSKAHDIRRDMHVARLRTMPYKG